MGLSERAGGAIMVEAISTEVVDLSFEEIETKQIIPIHPDAKYVIIMGETDPEMVEKVGNFMTQWYSDPSRPFVLLLGDVMLVRVDKLPPPVADRLGISG